MYLRPILVHAFFSKIRKSHHCTGNFKISKFSQSLKDAPSLDTSFCVLPTFWYFEPLYLILVDVWFWPMVGAYFMPNRKATNFKAPKKWQCHLLPMRWEELMRLVDHLAKLALWQIREHFFQSLKIQKSRTHWPPWGL